MNRREFARRVWSFLPFRLRNAVAPLRYGAPSNRQWIREVMNRDLEGFFSRLPTSELSALEVSGDLRGGLAWGQYRALHYPEFDICRDRLVERFDVVICEQVLEHVVDPVRAIHNLACMCCPGGFVVVSTPFLVRLHEMPNDYWRFTPGGLRVLLEGAGLEIERLSAWGNRAAVTGNLRRWRYYRRSRSLRNEPHTPVVVWAICRVGVPS